MTGEFNLSKYLGKGVTKNSVHENHIKEFIKRLKEVFSPNFEDDWAEKEIDKLAGDKLICKD